MASISGRSRPRAWLLLVAVGVAACGKDEPSTTATTTSTTSIADPAVIEDDRCDPAAEVLDGDDYELLSVISNLDVDTGGGPSDSVTCTFAVASPQESGDKPVRTFDVTASGKVAEPGSEG